MVGGIFTLENPLLEESLSSTFVALGLTQLKSVPMSDWPHGIREGHRSLWVVSMENDGENIRELKEGLKRLPPLVYPLVLTKSFGNLSQKLGREVEVLSLPVSRKQLVRRVRAIAGMGGSG